ncbi:MAG: hypothetical protein L6R42_000865 [Xanthoria sp. 1 TBL-2021]|nr:MAG: hypothetical protein L6R42_000865 [Xanthoria sp. 1 TBL-2021]
MEKERRVNKEQARANGFSCWDDYARSQDETVRIIHEKMIADHCAASGHTREQADSVLWHQNKSTDYSPLPPAPCYCHAQMAFSRLRNRLEPEELNIKEGNKSNRLDQDALEERWARQSQETSARFPFWASEDGVVQHILHHDICQITSDSLSPSLSPTPGSLYEDPTASHPSAKHNTLLPTNTSNDSNSSSGYSVHNAYGIPSSESSTLAPANTRRKGPGPKDQARQRY